MWEAAQSQFAEALIDRERPAPGCLRAPAGCVAAERFNVHRDNFVHGLVAALAVRFPAAQRIVGEEFFAAMAREFVLRHPPASPVLLEYGGGFAEFVEAFEPASALAYLPDVIRLEDARVRACHAADAAPLAPRDLAAVPTEQLADLIFDIHPSTAILRSRHPIVTIWAMNMGEAELAPIEVWAGEDALVVRPALHVHVHRFVAGGAILLERLIAGAPLGDAAQAAMQETASFDLAEALAAILGAGALAGLRYPVKGDGQ
jgi:hypothetical protein